MVTVVGAGLVVGGAADVVVVEVGSGLGGVVVCVGGGGGLDQVLVQVYVLTQLGRGALAGAPAGSGLAAAAAGFAAPDEGVVVRTVPPDPAAPELISSLSGALAWGLGESAAGGTAGVEVVLTRWSPGAAFAEGLVVSLRAIKKGIDATPAAVSRASAPARTSPVVRRELVRRR